jgi:GH24 family phage-related lysozyme (muramidase)/peptidoglycan hydrolase-like protein with peptidoglycan-binding domain
MVLFAIAASTTAAAEPPTSQAMPAPTLPSVDMAALVVASQVEPRLGNRPALGDDASTKIVQQALTARGFATTVDGWYGAETAKAYQNFQKSLGYAHLGANGIPGAASLAELGDGRFTVTNEVTVGARTTYGGKTVNTRTKMMLAAADAKVPWEITLVQGSYNTTVDESAGTHDGGGAADLNVSGLSQTQVWETVRALRSVGFAAWYRPANSEWDPHIHGIAVGDTDVSRAAANQVGDYYDGDLGLQGAARDNTPTAYRVEFSWWERENDVVTPPASGADSSPRWAVVDTRSGARLHYRTEPNTGPSAEIKGRLPDGADLQIFCHVHGETVSGTYGTSNIWNRTKSGYYVPDVFLYTGSDDPVVPECEAQTDEAKPVGDRHAVAELRVSDEGISFIAKQEGFRANVYDDKPNDLPNSNCTQGYGNKLHEGQCTDEDYRRPPVTEAQAYKNLQDRVRDVYAPAARELVADKKMHQHEFDALVSMVYNMGAEEIRGTNLHDALLNGPAGWEEVPDLMLRFVNAGGHLSCGLYQRRIEEGRIWASADYASEATDEDCPSNSLN